jgi:hypothetical protein
MLCGKEQCNYCLSNNSSAASTYYFVTAHFLKITKHTAGGEAHDDYILMFLHIYSLHTSTALDASTTTTCITTLMRAGEEERLHYTDVVVFCAIPSIISDAAFADMTCITTLMMSRIQWT